jgi:hypothetical protein
MSQKNGALEREFEELLVEVLTQDYDLAVRRSGDPLDRRRQNVATLRFDYRYPAKSPDARVVVGVEGVGEFSTVIRVDFTSQESICRCAEDCEALALYLSQHLEGRRVDFLAALGDEGGEVWDRREDDYP